MKRPKLAVTDMDKPIAELVRKTNHKTLAIWAAECAERVLPYFEEKYPEDTRPRKAIEACRDWARTGVFRMADVRKISLAADAAAREVKEGDPAHSAARAAGQAMATAHFPTHAVAAAIYAATAVRDAADPADADITTTREREWQYQHLLELTGNRPLNFWRSELLETRLSLPWTLLGEGGFVRNLPLPLHWRWRRRRKPSGFRTSRIAPRPMAGCSRSGSDEPFPPPQEHPGRR